MAQRIGHYLLLDRIGRGGMGEVYRAKDTRLARNVAIKVLPASLTTDDESRKRFEREARAAASLNHPNIVTIHEFGEHHDRMYIVMELIAGQSLHHMMQGRPLPIEQAMDIATQLAEGLAGAHSRGVVHRDVKPENAIVGSDGRVKIVDFGLAKLKDASRVTKKNKTVGTALYMSPEQTTPDDVDRRTDVW